VFYLLANTSNEAGWNRHVGAREIRPARGLPSSRPCAARRDRHAGADCDVLEIGELAPADNARLLEALRTLGRSGAAATVGSRSAVTS